MLNEKYNYEEIYFNIDSAEECKITSKPITKLLIIIVVDTVLKKMLTSKTLLKNKKEKLLQLATKYDSMISDKGAETILKNNFITIFRELAAEINDNKIFDEAMNSAINTIHKHVLNDETIDKEKLTKQQKKDGL